MGWCEPLQYCEELGRLVIAPPPPWWDELGRMEGALLVQCDAVREVPKGCRVIALEGWWEAMDGRRLLGARVVAFCWPGVRRV